MIDFAIYSFTVLFIIVDPIGNVPVFYSVLEKFKPDYREPMVRKAVIIAALVLFVFTLLGRYLFDFFGIQVYSFRIAGGILLFIIAIEMLFGQKTRTESSVEEEDEAKRREDIVATPLAVPLLTGPGAITAGIMLFNSASSVAELGLLLVNILLVFIFSYIILSKSEIVFKALGTTGTRVIVRIMGLMLSAIAVQFVITGVGEAVLGLAK